MLICNKNKYILFLSKCYVGKIHDYAILKNEFTPDKNWFKNYKLRVDLGYLGIEKDYKCGCVTIPKKNSKKYKLSEEDKISNKQKAKDRITVEHSICGLKRYKILENRLRIHDFYLYDIILETSAALWNFYIKN